MAIHIPCSTGVIIYDGNGWNHLPGGLPDPIKRRAEELWQQHQKLESLEIEDLAERFDQKLRMFLARGDCHKTAEREALEHVVTADRKREAEIRGRESGWQPIETAPTDGTRVLVWARDHGRGVDHSNEEQGLDWGAKWTHWRPIPEAPND